jgi:hypothetical protein
MTDLRSVRQMVRVIGIERTTFGRRRTSLGFHCLMCRGAVGIAAGVGAQRTGIGRASRVPGAQASLHPIWGGTLQRHRTCATQPLPSEEDPA